MIEKQIDEIFLLSERQPVLTADETEAVAKFEQERLQVGDQAVFQFAFLDRAADAEEFQVVGTL